MAQYSATAASFTAAAGAGVMYIVSDGNVLPEWLQYNVGGNGTPSDRNYEFDVFNITAVGTGGTSVTAKAVGPGAASSASVKKGTYSGAPTLAGVAVLNVCVYHKGPRQFQWAPGDGLKAVLPTAAYGLMIYCTTAPSTDTFSHQVRWQE